MNKNSILAFIILFKISYTSAQQNDRDKTEIFIDSLIQLKLKTFEVPGISIGIIKDNKVWYAKSFGVQSLHTQKPLTNKSVFHMASVSKPFAATAIMKLVEDGKLKLSDKLIQYLPTFSMKSEQYKDITLQHILTHTSGIPDVEDYNWKSPEYDDLAALRYVKTFQDQKLEFIPGKEHEYSNAAYNLLAAVVQNVTKKTFEDYMQQTFFNKMELQNTSFSKLDVNSNLATDPHVEAAHFNIDKANIYPYNRIHAPSSTLHSNVDDMLLWAQLYLNKGNFKNQQLFSKNTYKQLTQTVIPFENNRGMCLGWFTSMVNNKKMFRHSGGDEGYSTFFGFLPEENFAITIMANSDTIITEYIAAVIIQKMYNNKNLNYKTPISFALRKVILEKDIETFKEEYHKLQKNASNVYAFGKGYLDGLGYDLLDNFYYEKAVGIFKFNLELQPEVAGFYDSVGDGYLAWNKPQKALLWFKKANEKDPKKKMSLKKIKQLENNR